jgi:hypothetical protein
MQYQKRSRTESQWRERLGRWQRSGLSITAFCRLEQVSLPSFFQWRKRLQREGNRRTAAFVPVEVVPDAASTPADERVGFVPVASTRPWIEIHCESLVLHVPPGVDERSLRQVLRVAREEVARC